MILLVATENTKDNNITLFARNIKLQGKAPELEKQKCTGFKREI